MTCTLVMYPIVRNYTHSDIASQGIVWGFFLTSCASVVKKRLLLWLRLCRAVFPRRILFHSNPGRALIFNSAALFAPVSGSSDRCAFPAAARDARSARP